MSFYNLIASESPTDFYVHAVNKAQRELPLGTKVNFLPGENVFSVAPIGSQSWNKNENNLLKLIHGFEIIICNLRAASIVINLEVMLAKRKMKSKEFELQR